MLTGDRKKNGEKLAIEVLSVGNCYFCIYLRYVCVCVSIFRCLRVATVSWIINESARFHQSRCEQNQLQNDTRSQTIQRMKRVYGFFSSPKAFNSLFSSIMYIFLSLQMFVLYRPFFFFGCRKLWASYLF